jgi:protein required for attachment to host cells
MRVPPGSYVLIADGRKRLVARNDGEALRPALRVVEALEDSNPPTREQVTDAPGRASSPVGGGTSLSKADAHEVEEQRFVADTADLLRREALGGAFEQLIVIAPAKTLGELRKQCHAAVTSRIIGEIGKDLTGHPIAEIEQMLLAHDSP